MKVLLWVGPPSKKFPWALFSIVGDRSGAALHIAATRRVPREL